MFSTWPSAMGWTWKVGGPYHLFKTKQTNTRTKETTHKSDVCVHSLTLPRPPTSHGLKSRLLTTATSPAQLLTFIPSAFDYWAFNLRFPKLRTYGSLYCSPSSLNSSHTAFLAIPQITKFISASGVYICYSLHLNWFPKRSGLFSSSGLNVNVIFLVI